MADPSIKTFSQADPLFLATAGSWWLTGPAGDGGHYDVQVCFDPGDNDWEESGISAAASPSRHYTHPAGVWFRPSTAGIEMRAKFAGQD